MCDTLSFKKLLSWLFWVVLAYAVGLGGALLTGSNKGEAAWIGYMAGVAFVFVELARWKWRSGFDYRA